MSDIPPSEIPHGEPPYREPDRQTELEMQEPIQHEPPVFSDRSPKNIERFLDFVEEVEQKSAEYPEGIEAARSEPDSEVREQRQGIDSLKLSRVKTPHRLRYEAEVEVIKRQIGDLETVRQKLGLSQRKICQLLMVDPSAWSRWIRDGAPPHVYRALEWYLLLTKEAPAHAHTFWLATIGARPSADGSLNALRAQAKDLKYQYAALEAESQRLTQELMRQRRRLWLLSAAFATSVAIALALYFLHFRGASI